MDEWMDEYERLHEVEAFYTSGCWNRKVSHHALEGVELKGLGPFLFSFSRIFRLLPCAYRREVAPLT